MGWFWGVSDNEDSKTSSEDPLRNLDPALRDFLAKESPVKYSSSDAPTQSQAAPQPASRPEPQPANKEESSEGGLEKDSKVPQQSLYQDGRYAHLWSTYQPQATVEAAFKSDAEKIDDVLEGYKQRKAQIGRAALENCALEQWDVNECFRTGGVVSRLTMCRAENRKFERCYTVQAKFLKALGYLSTYDRPAEIDEKIQMHADTLYHRMLDQEAAIEAAKVEGRPVPDFPPLVTARVAPMSGGGQVQPSDLPLALQKQMKKRLDGLSGEEREVEEKAIEAEIEVGEHVAGYLGNIHQKQEDEKKKRKEEGRETLMDKLSSTFRFGK